MFDQPRPCTLHAASAVLAMLMVVQLLFSDWHPRQWRASHSPGAAPDATAVQLAALGEAQGAARAMSLYVQSFDAQAGQTMAIRDLDLDATRRWLVTASTLAPRSPYPTFLASRIYASVAPPWQARRLLNFVAERYPLAPGIHWPWLAHAVFLAEHELRNKPLARRYAHQLRVHAGSSRVPSWARAMEVFLLQDLNEFEAAQTLLGGLIDSGQIHDKRALQVMINDLERIRRELLADQRSHHAADSAE